VDSVAVVRDCAGYSGGGMKKGASSCAWRVKRLHGGHVEQAWQRREDGMVGTATARRAVTRSEDAGCPKPTGSVL
jgi:hypothetical protein